MHARERALFFTIINAVTDPILLTDTEGRLAAYARMRERARDSFSRFAETLPRASDDIRLLGTSGTVTTLASVHLALPSYDRRAVDGLHVPTEAMQKISSMIARMDYEERANLPCIGRDRADLVVAGCAILEAILEIWPAPMFEVMMMIVLRKSTVRPFASARRPSSKICSRMLKTSGCAFSISSSRITEYGRRRTASVSWPPSS